MAVRKFKPVTPGQRNKVISTFSEITAKKPQKSLLEPLKSTGGRNNTGQMTVRYVGGGHKRMYRIIDFRRDKDACPATVLTIEYDPNRSARIALVQYEDGEKRYIIAPQGLKVGQVIASGSGVARSLVTASSERDSCWYSCSQYRASSWSGCCNGTFCRYFCSACSP